VVSIPIRLAGMATATHTAQLMLEHTVELMVQDTADPHTPGMAMDTQALLQHTQATARAPTAAPTAAPMLQVPMVMDMADTVEHTADMADMADTVPPLAAAPTATATLAILALLAHTPGMAMATHLRTTIRMGTAFADSEETSGGDWDHTKCHDNGCENASSQALLYLKVISSKKGG